MCLDGGGESSDHLKNIARSFPNTLPFLSVVKVDSCIRTSISIKQLFCWLVVALKIIYIFFLKYALLIFCLKTLTVILILAFVGSCFH